MSPAEGMLSAPMATSCACDAFSRASNARPIAAVSSGFSSRSDSARPRRSSVVPLSLSRRLLATLLPSGILVLSLVVLGPRRARAVRRGPTAKEGYGAAVAERLFLFVQLEFPWELGPPDGRYLLRAPGTGEPEHVVVLGTLGAALLAGGGGLARPRSRRRTRTAPVQPTPEPSQAPVA